MKATATKLYAIIQSSFPKSSATTVWLIKLIIPVSLAVSVLHHFGFLEIISSYLAPIFSVIGLPGDAVIVFVSSLFLSLYVPIAIIATLPLNIRDITILAVMCLIAHNLIVESAVQKKTGSKFYVMFILRIVMAFVAAYLLNLLLPASIGGAEHQSKIVEDISFYEMLRQWLISSFWLILKITLIVFTLMAMQAVMRAYGWIDKLSEFFAPLMGVMGLSRESSFLWIIAHTLGLAYGSAVMIEEVSANRISKKEANLLNHHIAINHSTIEDTLLFAAIGVPILWMVIPRFILSILQVWLVRLLSK